MLNVQNGTVTMGPTDSIRELYRQFGPPKPMGTSAPVKTQPHFFLHRNFLGEQDLAILFNTKRCAYQCKFCALPFKSSHEWVDAEHVLAQFLYVIHEVKHSIGVLERLTVANEGSVFDETTFPREALTQIVESTRVLPRIRKVVLETRLEFIRKERLAELGTACGKKLDILTGFETQDPHLRDVVLGKREPLSAFLKGLDIVASAGAELTTYVLFKPAPTMTDEDAIAEAELSIDYVARECGQREIPFSIRLNPMYNAQGTPWHAEALRSPSYRPPRLTDVIQLAEKKKREGIRVYLGLTSEGLAKDMGTYRAREDFSSDLIKIAITRFNSQTQLKARAADYGASFGA